MPLDLDAILALADSTPTLILRTEASITRDARALAAFKGGADAVEMLPDLVAELRDALATTDDLAVELADERTLHQRTMAELRVTLAVAEAADRVMHGVAVQSELRAALTAWHEHNGEGH